MSRIAKMLDKRAKLVEEMETIAEAAATEERDLSAAEQKAFDEREEEMKKLDAQIAVEKRLEAARAATAKPVAVAGNRDLVPAQPKRHYGNLKSFKGDTAVEDAYLSGQFLRAALFDDKSAKAWCEEKGIPLVQKYQNEGTNSGGGFLVPLQLENTIINLRETYGTFRTYVPNIPMSSDSLAIPRRTGGVTAYYVNENTAITESEKTWGRVNLIAKKLAVLTRMSTELAEDAIINIADDLANEIAYAFAKAEDDAGWNGDGTSTYGGIYGFKQKFVTNSTFVGAVGAPTNTDTFAEVVAADILKLMGTLPKYAEPNAKFYCSQQCWFNVFQRLTAAAGGTSLTDLNTDGKPMRAYLGYPVVIDQTLPTTTGSLVNVPMFYFGDLALAAKLGNRRGVMIRSLQERYAEFDQIGIMGTQRFDINVHDLGDTSVAGPVVALIGK
jgi:HK97 family phage major capsid protein